MKKLFVYPVLFLTGIFLATWLISGCGNSKNNTEMELKEFIKKFEAKYVPLVKESAIASWNAETSGNEAEYKKSADLEFKVSQIFANKQDFETLKKFKESKDIKDPLLKRQLDILYNGYLGKQIDSVKTKKMIDLQSEISQAFNTFRPVVGKDTLTDNRLILFYAIVPTINCWKLPGMLQKNQAPLFQRG